MQDLSGKLAWITGAGTGMGAAGAEKLAGAGCGVVLSGRRPEPLEEVAAGIRADGGFAVVVPLDPHRVVVIAGVGRVYGEAQ